MKGMNIKTLACWCFCLLLLPLQSCNDDVDDLQAQANLLKERVTVLEQAVEQLNTSVAAWQYLQTGAPIVGVTPVEKGYRIEISVTNAEGVAEAKSFEVVTGENVEGLLPLMRINADGYWECSTDQGKTYTPMTDADGNKLTALPGNAEGKAPVTPRLRIDADGYWQVSYDDGTSWQNLTADDGSRVYALAQLSQGANSIFSNVIYDKESATFRVTLKADGKDYSFPVVDTFYLKLYYMETTTEVGDAEQVFPLATTLKFKVTQSEVQNVLIQAPEGWKVKLDEDMLTVTSPASNAAEVQEKINLVITSPENYIRVVTLNAKFLTTAAEGCTAWTEFVTGADNNVLLDFSYAGYMHGEVAPPDVTIDFDNPQADAAGNKYYNATLTGDAQGSVTYKVYNVVDYGADGTDEVSDRPALIKILKDVMGCTERYEDSEKTLRYFIGGNNANAIIYFPEGKFILRGGAENETVETLRLTMGNLIVKGAGAGKTTIEMAVKNNPTSGDMWSTPNLLEIKHNSGMEELTGVTGDAAQGTFSVKVASTAGISAGDWVCLSLVNHDPELIAEELAPHSVDNLSAGDKLEMKKTGVQVYDLHQVKSISNGTLTFVEPIMRKVDSKWGWKILKYPHYENVGVEDLKFLGHSKDDFKHHGSADDDGAFKPINLIRLTNSWMRRVDFESVSEAASIVSCANVSAYTITITGNRGHSAVRSQASSRVFIGDVTDKSNGYIAMNSGGNQLGEYMEGAGQYHGCGVSKQSMGAVIWNVTWGNDGCFESHATQPRATLIDQCTGAFIPWREGGDEVQLPNHLNDLTIWNMNATKTGYDAGWGGKFIWWDTNNKWWKNLPPIIVGFHGASIIFDETEGQTKRLESIGTAVTPGSLYEAQLKRRLGYVPGWLTSLK